ncbi:MAG: FecR domain-containing protein [Spirochaetales bacterium]|nr:FecR domain-containing protein [Spirochaetales bacterium]
MKKIYIILFIFLVFSVFPLFSQTSQSCVIIYADGDGFTHVRGGTDVYYDLFETDVLGLVFRQGDILITEPGTVLELQVSGSDSIIKISENSSFRIDTFPEKGGGLFSLTYGRIRAKVEKLTGSQSFKIDGKSAVCGVRGTDFGYDIIADPAGLREDILSRVYCFSGSVEVVKKTEQPVLTDTSAVLPGQIITSPKENSIIITANEMVAIKTSEPEKLLAAETVPDDVTSYWDINDFISKPLSTITMQEIRDSLKEKETKKEYRLFWGSMGMILAGTGLEIITLISGNIANTNYFTASSPYYPLVVTGGILIGAGAGGIAAGIIRY